MYPGTHAAATPDKPAVVVAGTDRVVTYGELNSESLRLARRLRAAGLQVGDRVAIAMDNDPRFLTVCWAARRTGLYFVPLNWHLTAPEMEYVVSDAGAKVVIANEACAEIAGHLLEHCPTVELGLAVDVAIPGFEDLDESIAAHSDGPLDDEVEGLDIIYTSGTTGRPKGGVRPLPGVAPGTGGGKAAQLAKAYGFDADAIYLTPGAPLYHGAPLRFAMAMTELGGTNVLLRRFEPEAALAAIERHGVTASQWVPTMFVRLLRLPDEVRARYDLSSLQLAVHGAAPCPVSVKRSMIEWWGPILTEYYGASEGGPVTMITAEEWLAHPGSVGRASIGTIHIMGDDGAEVGPGEVGVVFAEDAPPIEYWKDAEKTSKARNERGWTTVGDVGYLDEDGYLHLTDRKDHMIVSGGVNIYPQEAEDVLIQHPSVGDVAVIGVPNDEYGEEVKAVVEVEPPAVAGEALATELVAFCRDRLAHYKCPRTVDFVDQLPRSDAGKLYKRRLLDQYWHGHASRVI